MVQLQQLEVNDVKIPYFSDYVYVEEIEYKEQPKRTLKGKIKTWPTYWFIATIDIKWNYLTTDEYSKLLNLVRIPNFKFKYFDTNNNVYKVGKFYCSQESYNSMVAKYATVRGYENVTLRFIATNDDLEEQGG